MSIIRRNWVFYLLLAPALLYFSGFVFYPMAQGVLLSFQEAGILGSKGFVGFDNYDRVFNAPNVWRATFNTLALAGGITFLSTILPIIPAIALAEITPQWVKRSLQTIIYAPYLLSWVIIVGVVINTLSPIGVVNSVLIGLHIIDQPYPFLSNPNWARPLVIGQSVWKDIGFHALIYLSALLSLNTDIIEAAEIDGANGWHKIWYLVLPHLRPAIGIVFVINLQGSLHLFDSAFLMLNGRNADEITTLAIFSYQRGVLRFDLGLASAAGTVLLVICLVAVFFTRFLLPTTRKL